LIGTRPLGLIISKTEIAKIFKVEPRDLPSPKERTQYDAERTAALAKFDEAKAAYDAKMKASRLAAAERLKDRLENLCIEAEEAVLSAKPQSKEGAVALLIFAAELAAHGLCPDPNQIGPP
jgi:hypothetical protein